MLHMTGVQYMMSSVFNTVTVTHLNSRPYPRKLAQGQQIIWRKDTQSMATKISHCFLDLPLTRAGRASLFRLLFACCFTFATSAQDVINSYMPNLASARFAKPLAAPAHDLPAMAPPPFYRTSRSRTLICLLLLGGTTFAWKRSVAQLQRENSRLHEFSRRLLESQERERKRMAVELHDSLG